MPIVHTSEVWIAVRPERLRVAQIDAGFSRKASMPDAATTGEFRDAERILKIAWRADLFDDFERVSHADDFKVVVE